MIFSLSKDSYSLKPITPTHRSPSGMAARRMVVFSDDDSPPRGAPAAADTPGSAAAVWNDTPPAADAAGSKRSAKVIDLSNDDGEEDDVATAPKRQRPAKGNGRSVKKQDHAASGSGSDANSDSGEEYGDVEAWDSRTLAERALKKCENFSSSLRLALSQWEAAAAAAQGPESSHGKKDCVSLIAIADSSSNAMVTTEAMLAVCPNLVLKDYQLVGVNWIKLLHDNPPVNGVLADDMGLGKTIQTLAFLGWLKKHNQDTGNTAGRPHLIVVPASTLSNWVKEIELYLPNFSILVFHGSVEERNEMRYEYRESIDNGEIDVVLSTYSIFEKESCKADRSFLQKRDIDYLVLDEAHCMKNSANFRFNNLNKLRPMHRLLLSGTPVQNNPDELLTMLAFLMPRVFSSKTVCALSQVRFILPFILSFIHSLVQCGS